MSPSLGAGVLGVTEVRHADVAHVGDWLYGRVIALGQPYAGPPCSGSPDPKAGSRDDGGDFHAFCLVPLGAGTDCQFRFLALFSP